MTQPDIDRITADLMDAGKIIEAGWHGFRLMVVPPDAGMAQLRDMRAAFFGGALHLFTSIIKSMDAGDEPTEQDMQRIQLIQEELEVFGKSLGALPSNRRPA